MYVRYIDQGHTTAAAAATRPSTVSEPPATRLLASQRRALRSTRDHSSRLAASRVVKNAMHAAAIQLRQGCHLERWRASALEWRLTSVFTVPAAPLQTHDAWLCRSRMSWRLLGF